MRDQIPNLVAFQDTKGHAMVTFLESLGFIQDRPCVMLEDDIELTSNFCAKIEPVIAAHPASFKTFFSLSKKYTASRWANGGNFCMSQCLYFPPGYALHIAQYYADWPRKEEHPTGYDFLIADWLKSRKERYYIHCPSLVQHLPVVSLIDGRRSKFRQSPTFER